MILWYSKCLLTIHLKYLTIVFGKRYTLFVLVILVRHNHHKGFVVSLIVDSNLSVYSLCLDINKTYC